MTVAKVAYFDCFSGVSGDMILGALIDAGCPPRAIARDLKRLSLPPWHWTIDRVKRGGFYGTRVEVKCSKPPRRLLATVMRSATSAGLPAAVAVKGERIVRRILTVEGKVHGVAARHVHLHELEDLDTIVDIYGVLLALHQLGVERIYVSPVTVGTGTVTTQHGELPIPAPGTAELLRGQQVQFGSGRGELATPTGVAILAILGTPGLPPPVTVERIGYGAGATDGGPCPNLLRVFLGSNLVDLADGMTEDICQIDAVVDDMSPQLIEAFLGRAYREGALEAWTAPVQMKRSRPGMALTALAEHGKLTQVVRAFLEETSTLGVRVTRPARIRLPRRIHRLRTRFGVLHFKVAGAGATLHAVPEYREVVRLAERAGVPARLVLEEARGLWWEVSHRNKRHT